MAASKKGTLVAKETVVVVVGAEPVEYGKITVTHNKTGERVTIDNQNDVVKEAVEGVMYSFRAFQKVNPNHPAVKQNPNLFMPLSDVEDVDLDSVTA